MILILWVSIFLIGMVASVPYSSTFEWVLHRFVMHKPVPIPFTSKKFCYAFVAHAQTHHHIFKADQSYHLIDEKDKFTIPMAWWNGPALVAIATLPAILFVTIGHFTWGMSAFASFAACIGWMSGIALYYGTYEYIHWCMHLPKARRVERSWVFYRLNGHHLLHHRYMHKNFNVVLPFADLCLGTLLLRSKIRFPQARGASVPDVQPRSLATHQ